MKNNQAMDKLRKQVDLYGKENVNYRRFIEEHILKEGDELLFLTKTGSQLYGTNTPQSDLDIKGVFLPSSKSLLLDDATHCYGQYTTSKKQSNSSKDVDIELWSLHRLIKCLQKGDTNAYDLLYAPTHSKGIIYMNKNYQKNVFNNAKNLISSKAVVSSFIGYASGQVKRYEVKGLNFSTLKFIMKWFKEHEHHPQDALHHYIYDIIKDLKKHLRNKFENRLKTEKEVEKQLYVFQHSESERHVMVNNFKQLPLALRVKTVKETVQKWLNIYGKRVKNNDEGIDWKSISNAFRVLESANQLACKGKMKFPFVKNTRKKLLKIKNGKKNYKKIINKLEKRVDVVADKVRKSNLIRSKANSKKSKEILKEFYNI